MENKKHIVAVSAIVIHPKGKKFLILKRSKNEIAYPGKWCFPGGKVEKGQKVLDALIREVKEESGLDVESRPEFVSDFTFVRPDGHNVVGMTFIVKVKKDDVVIDKRDFDDFKWITSPELKNYDYIEDMEKQIEMIKSLL